MSQIAQLLNSGARTRALVTPNPKIFALHQAATSASARVQDKKNLSLSLFFFFKIFLLFFFLYLKKDHECMPQTSFLIFVF